MASSTNDVYVDANIRNAREWITVIPTIFRCSTVFVSNTDGLPIDVEFDSVKYSIYDIDTALLVSSGTSYANNNIYTSFVLTSGTYYNYSDTSNEFILVNEDDIKTDIDYILHSIYFGKSNYYREDETKVEYSTPSRSRFFNNDTKTEFKIYIGYVNYNNDVNVDLELAASRKFKITSDIFSTALDTKSVLSDVEVGSGRISNIVGDMFSCISGVSTRINTDIWNTSHNSGYFLSDVDVAYGSVVPIFFDINSTQQNNIYIPCDIRVWSLKLDNFFLDSEEFVLASSTAYIDIVDELFDVDISNTYFIIDGTPVSVTFSGIANGYRMFYDPPDDFYSKGSLEFIAHAKNTAGDVLENRYSLLFGYNVIFDDYTDWGYDKNIFVWVTAKNLAYCPNSETDAFYFTTNKMWYKDLQASIYPAGFNDLSATIYTQGKVFYYGGTYTITISGVRDFHGNEMETKSFTFTIEDPTL